MTFLTRRLSRLARYCLVLGVLLSMALIVPGAVSVAGATEPLTASPWHSTTPFSNGRTSASSVIIGNRVYLLGGYAYDEATEELPIYNDVQWATLSSSGGVSGGWHTTTPFTQARLGQTAVRYGDYIYVIGGGDGFETVYNTVEYAKVGPSGNITAAGWHSSPNDLIVARAAASSNVVVIGGQPYLYVTGGTGNNEAGEVIHFASVEYAPIHADGSLGKWTLNPTEFAKPRSSMTTAFAGGCLYVVGGFGEAFTEVYSDVQYACLHSNGSLGSWTTSPNSMHNVRYGAEMVVSQSSTGLAQLIELGGNAGEGVYLNEIERTTARGPLGNTPWTVAPSTSFLPVGQWGQTGVLYEGRVYVLGGVTRSQEYLNNVIYARVSELF